MSILSTHTFAYLDVETTGLSPWFGDRICEIAVIRCQGERVVDQFGSLVNPQKASFAWRRAGQWIEGFRL